MKIAINLVLVMFLSFLAGCATGPIDKLLPEGSAKHARATYTGKFSSTTVEAENLKKTPEQVTAAKITLKHSNMWVPNVEFTADDYVRNRSAKEQQQAAKDSPGK